VKKRISMDFFIMKEEEADFQTNQNNLVNKYVF